MAGRPTRGAGESGPLGEFDMIARYLAPLTIGETGAYDLTDDAALFAPLPGKALVLTKDAMVAGVHFLADDPPDLIARKLLRVNLSDLAAKGATPYGYLLSIAVPKPMDEAWIAGFAEGLAADQAAYDIHLLGGDTVSTPGPVTLSLTAIGMVPAGRGMIRRAGARAGDLVCVTGTIGDGALGLLARRGRLDRLVAGEHVAALRDAYLLPRPETGLGPRLTDAALGGIVHAGMDISDGLVADLGHMARASRLAAEIDAPAVPLSPAARAAVAADPALHALALTGGDDYRLLLAVAPAGFDALTTIARESGTVLTAIGRFHAGEGVTVRDAHGAVISLAQAGYAHF